MLTLVTNINFNLAISRIQTVSIAAVIGVSLITMSSIAISAESVAQDAQTVTPKAENQTQQASFILS
jgi:hypothetical protein